MLLVGLGELHGPKNQFANIMHKSILLTGMIAIAFNMTEREINQMILSTIFNNPTETSYITNQTRYYVSKLNEGHYIHYFFTYTTKIATLHYVIKPSKYDTHINLHSKILL